MSSNRPLRAVLLVSSMALLSACAFRHETKPEPAPTPVFRARTDIGKDAKAPQVFRDTAKVRAAWLLIDTGTYEQVAAEAEALTGPTQAMRNSAREALGLSAYKHDDFVKAKGWFEQITADTQAPRNVINRAQIMLDNITASGKAP